MWFFLVLCSAAGVLVAYFAGETGRSLFNTDISPAVIILRGKIITRMPLILCMLATNT